MADVLVDTKVLIDVATEDPRWLQWSSAKLANAMASGRVALLTRDAKRYREYFPKLKMIAPR